MTAADIVAAHIDRAELALSAREELLAAVAEGEACDPAGVTNDALMRLTPDMGFSARIAAIVALREAGLLARRGTRLRLTTAGAHAVRGQWQEHPTARTLTRAGADAIVADFARLQRRAPDLAAEVGEGFGAQWRTVERAVSEGEVRLDARMAIGLECMTDGIRDRLADTRAVC